MNDQRNFPQTYLKFEGKKEINGRRRKYWVQDLEENRFEEVIHSVIYGFIGDEPTTKYLDAPNDPLSLREFETLWREMLKQKLTIACFTKDEQSGDIKLAGFNILMKAERDDKDDFKVQGRASTILFNVFKYIESQRDFFKEFNLERYIKAMGLYVLPDYRGDGLGENILAAREFLCKSVGIPATLTAFTSIISQKLADRLDYQEFYTQEYERLKDIDKGLEIPKIHEHSKYLKYMYKIYL